MHYQFVADVHLGRLVKWLRLLGFDTLYSNEATVAQLAEIAMDQTRILLSKSVAFARHPGLPLLTITSSHSLEQLQQVMEHFHLKNDMQPFTRCLVCNGPLQPVSKVDIEGSLQPNTKESFNNFWQCSTCRRIYWEGSHYERMQQLVKQVQEFAD